MNADHKPPASDNQPTAQIGTLIDILSFFSTILNKHNVKRPFLFIGYEVPFRDEIREFMKARDREVLFSDSDEDTIKIMSLGEIHTVVLNMQRLEDAAILRYINIHYQKTQVLVMPGRQLKEAIPALTGGQFDLLHEPFMLEELRKFI